tara:strand:- start:158 stop:475 length:318 start_codon:yes stop_codon:yes gene_type:complete
MKKQKLLLDSQYKKLVANHKAQDGTKTFKAVVKLFNPTGIGTWYLSELNPETNVAFGLADVHEKELGYVDLNELQQFKGQFGLGIERDKWFKEQSLEILQMEGAA